jgi:hypothetical protein
MATPEQIEVIDIFKFAERKATVPHGKHYHVRIDGQTFRIENQHPTGEELLHKVGRRSCGFELIAEFHDRENDVIEPDEKVDLARPGLKCFITAHKEIVTIFINDQPKQIERGERTVAQILEKIGQTPETYMLLEEKDGSLMPLPSNIPVKIHGCECFHAQVQSGGSSGVEV